MARTMLNSHKLAKNLWAEAVHTACYTINRVYLRSGTQTTPYEIWKGKSPTVSYFHIFGSKCYVLNDKDPRGNFDAKSDEAIFLGYSPNSKAYRVLNKRTNRIMESANVIVDDQIEGIKSQDTSEDLTVAESPEDSAVPEQTQITEENSKPPEEEENQRF